MAYLVSSNLVFVSNKGNSTVSALDGTTGAFVGFVNVTGVSGSGTFQINQLAVADDGVLYGAGLTTAISATSGYKIYRWSDWTQPPAVAFNSLTTSITNLISGKRAGDMMAITGSGTNTVILVPVTSALIPTPTNLLFSTTDGTNFTPTVLYSLLPTLANPGAGAQFGCTFYTNNTFFLKPFGTSMYLVQYPPNFASLTSPVQAPVLLTNTVNSPLNGSYVLLAYGTNSGLLAAYGSMVNAAPSTVPVNLYNIASLSGLSTSLAATNTTHTAANGNFAGAVALGGAGKTNYIYTLDCNSRVTATAIIVSSAPTITSGPVGGTFSEPWTLSVTAVGGVPLSYFWQASTDNTSGATTFTNIPGANTNFYVRANAPYSNYYRVRITNNAGAATSSAVQVRLLVSVTNPVVTQLWRVAPGASGYPYLGTDNNTRGLGYDTNSQRLVVASISGGAAVYILDANTGTNIGQMSLSGLTLSGSSSISIDQAGVADDGVVYACNLAASSLDPFHLYQ